MFAVHAQKVSCMQAIGNNEKQQCLHIYKAGPSIIFIQHRNQHCQELQGNEPTIQQGKNFRYEQTRTTKIRKLLKHANSQHNVKKLICNMCATESIQLVGRWDENWQVTWEQQGKWVCRQTVRTSFATYTTLESKHDTVRMKRGSLWRNFPVESKCQQHHRHWCQEHRMARHHEWRSLVQVKLTAFELHISRTKSRKAQRQ